MFTVVLHNFRSYDIFDLSFIFPEPPLRFHANVFRLFIIWPYIGKFCIVFKLCCLCGLDSLLAWILYAFEAPYEL